MKKIFERINRILIKKMEKVSRLSDFAAFSGLLLFTFLIMPLILTPPDRGGDYAWKWSILRYYCETGIWYPAVVDHHQVRWSFNLPVAWIANLFDFHPYSYYILPVLFTVGIVFLVYWIVRQLDFSPPAAFLVAVAVLINPLFADIAGQFEPLIAMSFYALCGITVILYLLKKNCSNFVWGLSALLFFLAYGSKVTAVYSCIAVVLFLCFCVPDGKNLFSYKKFHLHKGAVIFFCTFFLLFVLETLILNHIFQLNFGRLEAITKNHLADPGGHLVPECFFDWLFAILIFFTYEGNRKILLIFLFAGISAASLFHLKNKKLPPERKFIFYMFWITYLFHCYAVSSVFPFRPVEPHLMRYQLLTLLYGIILCFSGLFYFVKISSGWQKVFACLFILSVLFLSAVFEGITIFRNFHKNHTLLSVINLVDQVNNSSKKSIPVLQRKIINELPANPFFSFYAPKKEFLKNREQNFQTVIDKQQKDYYILWGVEHKFLMPAQKKLYYVLESSKSEALTFKELELSEGKKCPSR